jgi:hypothetical protein
MKGYIKPIEIGNVYISGSYGKSDGYSCQVREIKGDWCRIVYYNDNEGYVYTWIKTKHLI